MTADDFVHDASRRHLMRRAATVGLMMRNCVNLLVALVSLVDPGSLADPLGQWLLGALACWSLYRIATRSQRSVPMLIDYLFVLAVCLAVPMLVDDPAFYLSNSAPQAIAGTAVISFSVALRASLSLPLSVGIAAAYAFGAAEVVGWAQVTEILAVYYFSLQWITSALIRIMLLRVASAVDQSRERRQAAQLNQRVSDAVRDFEREQLALLHDTAAVMCE